LVNKIIAYSDLNNNSDGKMNFPGKTDGIPPYLPDRKAVIGNEWAIKL